MTTGPDFTIADVLAWARTKPADEAYRFSDNTNCAICQFLRETGRAINPTAGSDTWGDWEETPYFGQQTVSNAPIPEKLVKAYALHAGTFGGLVTRLEALCPETPVTRSDWARLDAYLTDIERVSA